MRSNVLRRWSLNHLEVAKRSKLHSKILQCLGCLVDKQNVQDDVELVDLVSVSASLTRQAGGPTLT